MVRKTDRDMVGWVDFGGCVNYVFLHFLESLEIGCRSRWAQELENAKNMYFLVWELGTGGMDDLAQQW